METTFLIFQFVLICTAEAFVFHIFELSEDIKDKTCNANDVHKTSLQSGPVRCASQCMIQGESCNSFFYSPETQICDECKTIYNSTSQTVDIVGKSSYYIKVPVEIEIIVVQGATTETTTGITTEITTGQPTYIGCHNFVQGDKTNTYDDNKETVCAAFCASHLYDVYSTQNKRCDCHGPMIMMSLVQQPEEKCKTPCPGNQNEFCGDPVESTSSFYTSAFIG